MGDRALSTAPRRSERAPRQPLARKKSATVDWGSGDRWHTMPESPRWDCRASKSGRSNRSASCDSADVSRSPVRRRHETFSDAFEGMQESNARRSRPSRFLAQSDSTPQSPRFATTNCESPEYSRSICANASASKLSDGDRVLLLHVADRNSRALAKRAYRMLDAMHQRPQARYSAFLGGLMLSEAVPPHIDGYTLVENDRGTKIFQLDTGRESTRNRRQSRAGPQDRIRFLSFRKVRASVAEISDLLGAAATGGRSSELNPCMAEVRKLHALIDAPERPESAAPTGDGGRYVGLDWMCMQTPSWMGWKSSRLRDFLLLEDRSSFRAPDGRSGWVQSFHSVQLPWFPSQELGSCVVRGSMYQSGIVAIPAKEAPDAWVDVMCAVEFDLKGNASEKTHRALALKRLACLASLDQALVSQRLQRISFMDTRQFELRKPEPRRTCHICASRVRVFGRHLSCRKCGESICKKCSVDLRVGASGAEHKKRRVCARCVLNRAVPEPSASTLAIPTDTHRPPPHHQLHTASSGNAIGLDSKLVGLLEDAAARSRSARPPRSAVESRNARALTLPLATISEEYRSSQTPPAEVASPSTQPRPSSRLSGIPRYVGPADDARAPAGLVRSSPSSTPAAGDTRRRASTARELSRAKKKPRRSNGKNAHPPAERPWPDRKHSDKPTLATDLDSTPPSVDSSSSSSSSSLRGSSLRVQFLLDEIML